MSQDRTQDGHSSQPGSSFPEEIRPFPHTMAALMVEAEEIQREGQEDIVRGLLDKVGLAVADTFQRKDTLEKFDQSLPRLLRAKSSPELEALLKDIATIYQIEISFWEEIERESAGGFPDAPSLRMNLQKLQEQGIQPFPEGSDEYRDLDSSCGYSTVLEKVRGFMYMLKNIDRKRQKTRDRAGAALLVVMAGVAAVLVTDNFQEEARRNGIIALQTCHTSFDDALNSGLIHSHDSEKFGRIYLPTLGTEFRDPDKGGEYATIPLPENRMPFVFRDDAIKMDDPLRYSYKRNQQGNVVKVYPAYGWTWADPHDSNNYLVVRFKLGGISQE